MALMPQADVRPRDKLASTAARSGRFLTKVARASERYGNRVALQLVARRGLSFVVRGGTSVICAWHEGMELPSRAAHSTVQVEEIFRRRLPDIAALMGTAGWEDAALVARTRFAAGDRCFAAQENGRLVAHLWTSRAPHNFEGLWDLRLGPDEARTFDWFTLPEARGKRVIPALLWRAIEALRKDGVRHVYTSIGGDNVSSLHAAAQIFPVRREFQYVMTRGMRRPLVIGMAQSICPSLDPVERPFERINVTNLVL